MITASAAVGIASYFIAERLLIIVASIFGSLSIVYGFGMMFHIIPKLNEIVDIF